MPTALGQYFPDIKSPLETQKERLDVQQQRQSVELGEKTLANYDKDRQREIDTEKIKNDAKYIQLAINSGSKEGANSILKHGGVNDVSIEFDNETNEITLTDTDAKTGQSITVKGDPAKASKWIKGIGENPNFWLDADKRRHAIAYGGAQGLNIKIGKGESFADKVKLKRTDSSEKETKADKKLKVLASDYFQAMGRGYSAERGVGQFVPDENKEAVAKKAYDSASIIAQQYVNAGGKWEDLGLEDPEKAGELPEGLTEVDVEHNMKKYKKTREEVIAKFLEGKK